MTTRAEHIRWCKKRALEYVEAGLRDQAVASMMSDLRAHPETEKLVMIMGEISFYETMYGDDASVRRFIEGFAE